MINVVAVYKIDRLSYSLIGFLKLGEIRAARRDIRLANAVIQITTIVGRLVLIILAGFAQYEREAIWERIRDKFTASRTRGMRMGGRVPLRMHASRAKTSPTDATTIVAWSMRWSVAKTGGSPTYAPRSSMASG